MKFFTDKTVKNPYLLIKIKDFIKIRTKSPEFLEKYKEIFIDPGVYELTKSDEYSFIKDDSIDINEFLDSLKSNEYLSLDYPCDMNEKYTDIFLIKSWENAIKYCNHPQYIITAQYQFNNYRCFKWWFDKYNQLPIKSGILGLGNLCRIFYLTEYMKMALEYAFKNCKYPRIHIYGLAMRNIKFAYDLAKKYNIELSIDSTKWTSAVNNTCRDLANGRGYCTKGNRQAFFDEYMEVIKEKGVILE